MTQQKTRSGCLPAAIALGVVAAVGISALIAVAVMGLAAANPMQSHWKHDGAGGEDEYPNLRKVWSYGSGETTVVRIPVQGILTRAAPGGMFGGVNDPVGEVLACIQDATQDEDVKAIILEVDSPGGEVTASDVVYQALLEFKKAQRGRKVVALFGDVAASGAYYIAMAADCILIQPTGITGSIGVLISTVNFKGLGDKLGVHDVTIKSGANKDMLNPMRETTPEELALIQAVVDDIYNRFVKIVADGRSLPEDKVRAVADGRILTAQQALDAKLVDQTGYWDDAVQKTAELVGVRSVKVYKYDQRQSFFDMLLQSKSSPSPLQGLMQPQTPRFMYLWDL